MLKLRPSAAADLDRMEEILLDAKQLLRSRGIDQWQKGSPSRELLLQDIREGNGYVLEQDGRIVGFCALFFEPEEDYRVISEPGWLTGGDTPYGVIHRVAVAGSMRGQGCASALFSQAAERFRAAGMASIRIDTHPENRSMQRALQKQGFVRCGTITLGSGPEAGAPRVGFELLL